MKDKEYLPTFAALGILFCFIFGFLITHEVSLQDSLQLCAILALDLVTGAVIWILLSRKNEYSVFELLGVGVALGTSLNAIGQLFFRETILGSLFNYLFLVLIVLLFVQTHRKKQVVVQLSPTRSSTVLAVCATALILLCGDRYYLWVGVLILALAIYVLTKFEHNPSSNKSRSLVVLFSLGSVALALLSSSILEDFLFGPRSTTSYISGWDGVYFEAASKSLINYGPFDNFLIANNKYAYYWFSDAWSGAYTQRTMVNDWVVTTQFGFIVAVVTTTSLILAILSSWIPKQRYIQLFIIPLAATSFVAHPLNLFYLPSFSQVIATLLVTLFLFFLTQHIEFERIYTLGLSVLVASLVVLTKTLVALPVLIGVSVGVAILILKSKSIKKYLNLFIGVTTMFVTSSIVYLIFIQPAKGKAGEYSVVKFSLNGNIFGLLSANILLGSAIFLALPAAVFALLKRNKSLDDFSVLLLSISVSSFVLSILLSFNNSHANTYLILPFLLSFLLLAAKAINLSKIIEFVVRSKLQLLIEISLILVTITGALSTIGLHYLNYNLVSSDARAITTALIPFVVACTVFGIIWGLSIAKLPRKPMFASIIALILVAQTLGFYIGNSVRGLTQAYVYEENQWDPLFQDVETEVQRLTNSSLFINNNLDTHDLLASNSLSDAGLLAALTGIRNYASSYAPNLWGGEEHRYIEQDVFAKDPSDKSYVALRNGCVTWFYYDKDESPGKAKLFEPYATTKFEDEYGAVLKLSESYPLPDECFK